MNICSLHVGLFSLALNYVVHGRSKDHTDVLFVKIDSKFYSTWVLPTL